MGSVTETLLILCIVPLSAAVAVMGLAIVQRTVSLELRESHNAQVGIIYAALYVMFGMMIGFSAYLVMNKYLATQSAAQVEASNVEGVYWLANQLPEQEREEIQAHARRYVRSVVSEEWPLLEQRDTSPRTEELFGELRRSVEEVSPASDTEQAIYAQALEHSQSMDEARDVRLLSAREGLPPILWFVLVSLGVDTVLCTYFVGMKSTWLHASSVAALAAGISLILCTIWILDHPYGHFGLGPEAFELVAHRIGS